MSDPSTKITASSTSSASTSDGGGVEEAAAQRRRLLFAACLAAGAGLLAGVAGGLLTFGGILLGLELWAEYWTYRLVIERERRMGGA